MPYFGPARTALEEMRLLTTGMSIVEKIAEVTPDEYDYRDVLDLCNDAVTRLRNVVDRYVEVDGTRKYRIWGRRPSIALSTNNI